MSIHVVCHYSRDATPSELYGAVVDIILKPAARIGYSFPKVEVIDKSGAPHNSSRSIQVTITFSGTPPSQHAIPIEPESLPHSIGFTDEASPLASLLQERYEICWKSAGYQDLAARKLLHRCQVGNVCLVEPAGTPVSRTDGDDPYTNNKVRQWDFGKGTLGLSSGKTVYTSTLFKELLDISMDNIPVDTTTRAGGSDFMVLRYDSEIQFVEHCIDVFTQAKDRLREKDLMTRDNQPATITNGFYPVTADTSEKAHNGPVRSVHD